MTPGKHKATLFVVVVFVILSCTIGDGDGRVWGKLTISSCEMEETDFNMHVDFFAADYIDNQLIIRLQHSGKNQTYSDGVLVMVRDVDKIAASLGVSHDVRVEPDIESFVQKGPMDAGSSPIYPLTTSDSPVRATLYLNETCPGNRLAFTDGAGTITFEHIYRPDKNERIKGSFHFEYIDPREWESPEDSGSRADIFGEFDFDYKRGMPAQAFP